MEPREIARNVDPVGGMMHGLGFGVIHDKLDAKCQGKMSVTLLWQMLCHLQLNKMNCFYYFIFVAPFFTRLPKVCESVFYWVFFSVFVKNELSVSIRILLLSTSEWNVFIKKLFALRLFAF